MSLEKPMLDSHTAKRSRLGSGWRPPEAACSLAATLPWAPGTPCLALRSWSRSAKTAPGTCACRYWALPAAVEDHQRTAAGMQRGQLLDGDQGLVGLVGGVGSHGCGTPKACAGGGAPAAKDPIHYATAPGGPVASAARTQGRGQGAAGHDQRSEERRVGKEGRSRWSPYH